MKDGDDALTYESFLKIACATRGLNWRKYRRRAPRRNLEQRIRELGLTRYTDYLEKLRSDPGEAERFPDILRVTVSRFMRERERWEMLWKSILPDLVEASGMSPVFRVWSAGCCGGEEPYAFSLLWLDRPPSGQSLQILATDIDREVLLRADAGCYEAPALRELPESLVQKWFRFQEGKWCVREEVRRPVVFREMNLNMGDIPENMDVVLCRYLVFTYYQGQRRYEAASRLWKALRPGGVLVTGRKEGLGPMELERFSPWPGVEGAYRRKEV